MTMTGLFKLSNYMTKKNEINKIYLLRHLFDKKRIYLAREKNDI